MLLLAAAARCALGALLFAGALDRGHHAVWPGLVGGVACAAIGVAAPRTAAARGFARGSTGRPPAPCPLYTETVALLVAVLSVLAPPVGVIALAGLLWLLIAGRGREDRSTRACAFSGEREARTF